MLTKVLSEFIMKSLYERGGWKLMKRIMFSKMVQTCSIDEVANHAKALGFCGIDLTCRKGGHILPEKCSA